MKAKELRDGNWIITKPNANFVQNYIMKINSHAIANSSDQFNGIELSYDLLVDRCGFIDHAKNGLGCRIDVNSADELCFYVEDMELRYQTKGSGFTRDFGIKYLHQLQNMYYILTGKDLTITFK